MLLWCNLCLSWFHVNLGWDQLIESIYRMDIVSLKGPIIGNPADGSKHSCFPTWMFFLAVMSWLWLMTSCWFLVTETSLFNHVWSSCTNLGWFYSDSINLLVAALVLVTFLFQTFLFHLISSLQVVKSQQIYIDAMLFKKNWGLVPFFYRFSDIQRSHWMQTIQKTT